MDDEETDDRYVTITMPVIHAEALEEFLLHNGPGRGDTSSQAVRVRYAGEAVGDALYELSETEDD